MYERTFVEITAKHLAGNMRLLRGITPPAAQIMAVVKADGYGHGAVAAARTALENGASWLGVATVDEGVELRESGIMAPILVFSAVFPGELSRALSNRLTLTVPGEENAEHISVQARAQGVTAEVHIKIDTGMGRIGFLSQDTTGVLRAAGKPGLRVTGVYSHFADADDLSSRYTAEQFERFTDALSRLRQGGLDVPLRHMSNSSAALYHREYGLDMVRVGLAYYGLCPAEIAGVDAFCAMGFTPALAVKSHVAFVKTIGAGQTIGYARTFETRCETTVATVAVGYADGYGRLLSNNGSALIHGYSAPVIGNICMDQMMVDVTGIPDVCAGEEVVLVGKQGGLELRAEYLAALQQTIPYEIVTRLGKRAQRVFL